MSDLHMKWTCPWHASNVRAQIRLTQTFGITTTALTQAFASLSGMPRKRLTMRKTALYAKPSNSGIFLRIG
ncbi:hypothetical protein CR51_08255 [Caballeronia megalochromosomata]|nr:hypothetical protein CR51_08255 [Caballeronia megalochromosomata]